MEKFISILIDTNDVVVFDSQLLSINEEYILRAMVENNFILLVYDDYCYLRKRLVEYYSKKHHVPCMSKNELSTISHMDCESNSHSLMTHYFSFIIHK